MRIAKAFWQFPIVFEKDFLRQLGELVFEMRKVDCPHIFSVDAGPDYVRVATALFFVEDDSSWLAFQTKPLLSGIGCTLKRFGGCSFPRRWAEAHGEQKLLTARALGYRVSLIESSMQII